MTARLAGLARLGYHLGVSFPSEFLEDKYEVLSKMREGGMGEIYKVRHRLLDEERVIKLIRQKHAGDEDLRKRFENEARTAIRLRHPGIAQIYDLAIAPDDTAVIVMELIDGFSLQDLLKRGLPELGLVIEVAEQGLRALEFLHQKGYVHRDVSPDNLMLTRGHDGRPLVKLIDLGIAKRLGPSSIKTATGMFLGKARYSSPEQFGHGEIGAWSDVYSFGVMLYELLTGVRPVAGDELSQLIAGHLFRPPLDFAESDPGGRVPAELREVVLHALAKEVEDRIGSAAELGAQLAAFRRPFPSPFDGDATMIEPSMPVATGVATSPVGTAAEGTLLVGTAAEPTVPMPESQAPEAETEPETSVTKHTVRPARRSRAGRLGSAAVVALAVVAVLVGFGWRFLKPSPPSPRDAFRLGVLEVRAENWAAATSHLRVAAEGDPRSDAQAVEVTDGVAVAYLPHYFLGRSLFRMNNYVPALQAWKRSEEEGVVQGAPQWGGLIAGRSEVVDILREELEVAEAHLEASADLAGMVTEMLEDAVLGPVWDAEPELADRARGAVEEFERLSGQLGELKGGTVDLGDPRTATRLLDVRSRAGKLRRDLADLPNETLDASEKFTGVAQ